MSTAQSTTRPMPVEIDDPEDIEDHIVRSWLRHAPHFRIGKETLVIARGILPPRWKAIARSFPTRATALDFLASASRGGLRSLSVRELAGKVTRIDPKASKDEVNVLAADALVHGDLWSIRRNAHFEKGHADPSVFAALNTQYSAQIDFTFLAQWEGGQYLHGYVPFTKGIVAGNSGVTIATGYDIGQKSAAETKALKLPQEIEALVLPFADHRFRGMNHQRVVDEVTAIKAPVPVVTKAQADVLDLAIHGEHLAAAVTAWNGARKAGVPAFAQLPEPWQTVLFSRFIHQGKSAHRTHQITAFWTAATSGLWEDAITALRNYPVSEDWYKSRVAKEADHLKLKLPPPVVQPPKAPGAAYAPAAAVRRPAVRHK